MGSRQLLLSLLALCVSLGLFTPRRSASPPGLPPATKQTCKADKPSTVPVQQVNPGSPQPPARSFFQEFTPRGFAAGLQRSGVFTTDLDIPISNNEYGSDRPSSLWCLQWLRNVIDCFEEPITRLRFMPIYVCSPEQMIAKLMQQIEASYREGKYEDAQRAAELAAQLDPTMPSPRYFGAPQFIPSDPDFLLPSELSYQDGTHHSIVQQVLKIVKELCTQAPISRRPIPLQAPLPKVDPEVFHALEQIQIRNQGDGK